MDLYEVMRTTGAVREFTGVLLPDEVLERILDHARFAPSGGNRQGARVIVVRDPQTRAALAELTKPGARRYAAQSENGENPWNALAPPGVLQSVIDETPVPDFFVRPLTEASVVLVVCVDLGVVAATDQELDRVGIVGGASVYPLVWNILLAPGARGTAATPPQWLSRKSRGCVRCWPSRRRTPSLLCCHWVCPPSKCRS